MLMMMIDSVGWWCMVFAKFVDEDVSVVDDGSRTGMVCWSVCVCA